MQTYHKDTKKKRSKLNPIIGELFCFLRREFPVAETSYLKSTLNLFAIDVNRDTPHKNHVKLW